MKKVYWYGALAGFVAGLLFNVAAFSFPAFHASVADPGRFAWSFLIFCLCCFVLFAAMPWFRANLRAVPRVILPLVFSFVFFALGAIASCLVLFFAVSMLFQLWQPQIL